MKCFERGAVTQKRHVKGMDQHTEENCVTKGVEASRPDGRAKIKRNQLKEVGRRGKGANGQDVGER